MHKMTVAPPYCTALPFAETAALSYCVRMHDARLLTLVFAVFATQRH